jgi:hypothetical protein
MDEESETLDKDGKSFLADTPTETLVWMAGRLKDMPNDQVWLNAQAELTRRREAAPSDEV